MANAAKPRLVPRSIGGSVERARPAELAFLSRSGRGGKASIDARELALDLRRLDSLKGSGSAERRILAEKMRGLIPVLLWDAGVGAASWSHARDLVKAYQVRQRRIAPFANLIIDGKLTADDFTAAVDTDHGTDVGSVSASITLADKLAAAWHASKKR
jgi:hypothetical protein